MDRRKQSTAATALTKRREIKRGKKNEYNRQYLREFRANKKKQEQQVSETKPDAESTEEPDDHNKTITKEDRKRERKRLWMQNKRREEKKEKERQRILEEQAERRRERDKLKKQRKRQREKEANAKLQDEISDDDIQQMLHKPSFKSRTQKKRCIDKVKEKLPNSPSKKAEIVSHILKSPRTRKILEEKGLINTQENEAKIKTANCMVSNVKESLDNIKRKRSVEATQGAQVGLSLIVGPQMKKQKLLGKVAKEVGASSHVIAKAVKRHENIVSGTAGALTLAERKSYSIIPKEYKETAVQFWTSNAVSRPTGNKRDIVRKRIGPHTYTENEKLVLDMTQTEAHLLFQEKNPDIKMSQTTFERLKPFFIAHASRNDRVGCCCRYCVEFKMVYDAWKKHRDKIIKAANNVHAGQVPTVYEHASDVINSTLCNPKKIECIRRQCNDCGVAKLEILPEEKSQNEVKWDRYTYKIMPSGKRKLTIISQTTPHQDLVDYLLELLKPHPMHQFTARWQREQFQELVASLPLQHAIGVHDYIEKYACRPNYSTHSQYIDPETASIHITVLVRHSLKDHDGIESTAENPELIWEHFVVISPSLQQDSSSVHDVRGLLAEYFISIQYTILVLHEFTDGCSAQYKSRHCFLDVSFSEVDYGFQTIRNNHATAHAKGEQDAGGGRIKLHCDMGSVRGKVRIQSAHDAYTYLQETFTQPLSNGPKTKLKRRIFKYNETITGSGRLARTITAEKVRKLHSIRSCGEPGKLYVRELSCYCGECVLGKYDQCLNKEWVMPWRVLEIKEENKAATVSSSDADEQQERVEGPLDMLKDGDDVAISFADHITEGEIKMFHVSDKTPIRLAQDSADPWGDPIPFGNEVLCGNNYKLEKIEKRGRVYSLLPEAAHVRLTSVLAVSKLKNSKRKSGDFKFLSTKDYDQIRGLIQ